MRALSLGPLLCLHHCPETYFRPFHLLVFITSYFIPSSYGLKIVRFSSRFPALCFTSAHALSQCRCIPDFLTCFIHLVTVVKTVSLCLISCLSCSPYRCPKCFAVPRVLAVGISPHPCAGCLPRSCDSIVFLS